MVKIDELNVRGIPNYRDLDGHTALRESVSLRLGMSKSRSRSVEPVGLSSSALS
jgi:hypothetical protein